MWHLFHLVLVALLYFLAGKLGLSLPYVGDKVTLFWLPTGIAVAALLRWRWWGSLPGIFIGSCAVTLSVDGQWGVSLGVGVGNTLAPAVCVLLLRHWAFSPSFERRLDALKFCAASGISMLQSATIATLLLWLANNIESAQFVDVWRVWWLGDALGVLLAAPAMLALSRASWALVLEQRTEFLVWWIVAVVIGLVAFIGNRVSEGYALPLAFLPMPLAVWAALRFGLRGASL
ncbi:MAG: MASE1 domain-containing protein, partial [Gammaproteobacteria bacterium]|nr:MASE1 domain-containing protein [Gammaproteobacteria bacterium]